MNACQRSAIAVIGAMLDERGIAWTTHKGGKRMAVVARLEDGSEHKFPISGSPRADSEAQRNWCRQHVNAWLDRIGMGSGRGEHTRRAPKRHRRARVRSIIHRYEVGGCRLSEDPWEGLSGLFEP